MAKILSIEQELSQAQKVELFDKIILLVGDYIKQPTKRRQQTNKEHIKKEPINASIKKTPANIHFNTFWEKYPIERRVGSEAGTAKARYALTDEERTKAIDSIEPYKTKTRTLKDGLTYMLIPINYLLQKKRETFKFVGVDYTNLDIFHRYMRQGKEDLLREQLGDEYQEIKTKWKMSDLYLQP